MRILVLDGSGGDGRLALVAREADGLHLVQQAEAAGRGGAERLPGLLRALLDDAGWDASSLELIAAVVGPGSFTGLRATLALAHGLALGSEAALHGVTAGEALRRTEQHLAVGPADHLPLWCVGMARRDRVFIDRDERVGPEAFMLDRLPPAGDGVRLAGDASGPVAAAIARAGGVAHRSRVERAHPCAIAAVGQDRLAGLLPARPPMPLYVDPPEAKRPAAGLRPPPR